MGKKKKTLSATYVLKPQGTHSVKCKTKCCKKYKKAKSKRCKKCPCHDLLKNVA